MRDGNRSYAFLATGECWDPLNIGSGKRRGNYERANVCTEALTRAAFLALRPAGGVRLLCRREGENWSGNWGCGLRVVLLCRVSVSVSGIVVRLVAGITTSLELQCDRLGTAFVEHCVNQR